MFIYHVHRKWNLTDKLILESLSFAPTTNIRAEFSLQNFCVTNSFQMFFLVSKEKLSTEVLKTTNHLHFTAY